MNTTWLTSIGYLVLWVAVATVAMCVLAVLTVR